jgi:hypothetical protein
MISVESVPEMKGEWIKNCGGGEFKYNVFDTV